MAKYYIQELLNNLGNALILYGFFLVGTIIYRVFKNYFNPNNPNIPNNPNNPTKKGEKTKRKIHIDINIYIIILG